MSLDYRINVKERFIFSRFAPEDMFPNLEKSRWVSSLTLLLQKEKLWWRPPTSSSPSLSPPPFPSGGSPLFPSFPRQSHLNIQLLRLGGTNLLPLSPLLSLRQCQFALLPSFFLSLLSLFPPHAHTHSVPPLSLAFLSPPSLFASL